MVVEDTQHHNKAQGPPITFSQGQAPVCLYNNNSNGTQLPEISIIMPAFNEEDAVGLLIDRTQSVLRKITAYYEIIVIDDGSKDHTLNICRDKNVIIIHNRHNCGKGYALREGFKVARGNIIITMDSDGDHQPEEIPLLIQSILQEKVEVILGSRFAHNRTTLVTTVINTFGNRLFNFLIHHLTHHNFSDTQCGFRAFKRNCLSHFHLTSSGFNIETEMVVQLAQLNIPYREVSVSSPITYFRKSNINRMLDGCRIVFTIFRTLLSNFFKK